MIIQRFNLNLIPNQSPVIVHVNQYDTGTGRLIATLYEGNEPYSPSGTAVIQGTKPDGHGFQYTATLDGNVVTADLTEQMSPVAGDVRAQIVVTESSGVTGTFVFIMRVQPSALPNDTDMSESDYPLIEEAIEQMQELASDAAESAQEAAGFAQNSSDSAEDSEAWAVGTRNGEAVTPGDPTYHNNSKWYAEHGGGAGGGHTIVNSDGQDMPQRNALQFKGMNVTDDALNDMTIVEGGSGGSTIEVTTSEATLIGKNVTVSDGTNTWTAQFDNSGKAEFSGITSTGTLTISATDGSETAQYILTAPYFGKYAVTLAFWSATINVTTTTTQLNGKTVYAKKNGVVMGSGTFETDYGKNLLKNTATSQTINGVTFTVNADGSVTANGTATATINAFWLYQGDFNLEPNKEYILSGCPSGGSSITYLLTISTWKSGGTYANDTGNGVTINGSDYQYKQSPSLRSGIYIVNGTTVNNITFYPMLRLASDPDDTYVPYHDPITSASITVPEAGTYNLEVTLDWKTYTSSPFSVTEETTYNETIDGFIAPISLTTPTSEFYGQSISVTRNGVAVPVSLAFSNSGTASFTALDEGTYLFTLTYGGEPYTASVAVSAETTYSAVIKMWTATINITTPSSQMQSQDIDVYKGSAKVATIAFNASGQASYLAHEAGTYHFVCTVDGYPFTSADVVASDETVYSTSITYFRATLNISTSSSDLYSQTITIKKGSTTVGTTAFSAQGSASYTVHETGTYTCECEGYSGSATVSAETTYNVTINSVETYNITVTIYSAASDTLSYTDDNGAQTVTTNSKGKAENVSITITQPSLGVDPTITFTSSVAKNPSNLSNSYAKTITITENMTEIDIMPVSHTSMLYWYGYIRNLQSETGNKTQAPTYNTNYVTLTSPNVGTSGIVTISNMPSGTANLISEAVTLSENTSCQLFFGSSSPEVSNSGIRRTTTSGSGQVKVQSRNSRVAKVHALWVS